MRTFVSLLLLSLPLASAAWAADVPPLTKAEREALASCTPDKLDKKPCVDTVRAATKTCRDAHAHIHTNEWHHDVWLPFIKNLGGIYAGVGSDQGLTFIAAAHPTLAFMIDYDPNVVRINRAHRALILASDTPAAFLARWTKEQRKASEKLLREAYAQEPREAHLIARTYRWSRETLRRYFRAMLRVGKRRSYHWLHSAEAYGTVRALFRAGRIRVFGGDLLKDQALTSIGAAARKLGQPMRLLYLSNAEEYWRYGKQFRANIRALPFDDKGVVLRTRTSEKGPSIGRYQYIVQRGKHMQQRLGERFVSGVWSLLRDKKPVWRQGRRKGRRKGKGKDQGEGLFTVGFDTPRSHKAASAR